MTFKTLLAASVATVATVTLAGQVQAQIQLQVPGIAMPQIDLYSAVRVGSVSVSDIDFANMAGENRIKTETGYHASLALGTELNSLSAQLPVPLDLRVELELSQEKSAVEDLQGPGFMALPQSQDFGDVTVRAVSANLYADYAIAPAIDVFAGAGLAYGNVEFEKVGQTVTGMSEIVNMESRTTGYNLMGGVGYKLSPSTTLEAQVRAREFTTVDITAYDGTKTDTSISSQTLMVGIRYDF